MQALLAITVLGGVLRFSTIGLQSFWLDEVITGRALRLSFVDMLRNIPHTQASPPLYYVIAWPWARVFGTSELGLRSLSALFGTATVPVVYWAGKEAVSRRTGLAAAALAATSPYLFWWSQEARDYSLLVLLSGVAFALFVRALDSGTGVRLLQWGVAAALALATHYFAIFVLVPQAVWLVVRHGRRAAIAVGAGVLAVGAVLLPLALSQRANGKADWITAFPRTERVRQTFDAFLVSDIGPVTIRHRLLLPTLVLVVLAVVLLLARGGTRDRRRALIPLVVGGCGLLIPLLLAFVHLDYFFHRNLVAAWIPLVVVPAAGFAAGSGRLGLAALALLCVVGVAGIVLIDHDPRLQRPDWRRAATLVPAGAGSRVVVTGPYDDPLAWYLPRLRTFPAGGARVDELDYAGPAYAPLPERIGGFRRTSTKRPNGLVVGVYRAARPALLDLRSVQKAFPYPFAPKVLLDPGGP